MMLVGVIEYRLRPVEGSDSVALYDLHRGTMRTYVEDVWDEDVQLTFHERWMSRQWAQVIEVNGRLVGVVDTEWRDHRGSDPMGHPSKPPSGP